MTNELLWFAVFLQILMGGSDTLLHHEFTEKLAWAPSAKQELKLHAARNFIYAGLFGAFAWGLPYGFWASVAILFIVAEVLITLWDFVEEDLSRKLPATERVLHTLLALNYGAILILLLPELWSLSEKETDYSYINYGIGSIALTIAAIGVFLFGLRDYFAAVRLERFIKAPANELGQNLKPKQHILITGATGFIGKRLTSALIENGHSLIVYTRNPEKAAHLGAPIKIITSLDQIKDDDPIDAIINLAGEPLATGLWTKAKKQKILQSREQIADEIYGLCRRLYVPPKTVIAASAIGWYGLRGDETLNETSAPKPCFTHEVCQRVEEKNNRLKEFKCRTVNLRIGLVLGTEGGILANLLVPFEYGGGGPIGDGKHWMSWITRDDLVRLIVHCLKTEGLSGAVNAVAPHPVRNEEFTKMLGVSLNRPSIVRMPASLLKLVLGDFAKELLLASQHVDNNKIIKTGFQFKAPALKEAFEQILPMNKTTTEFTNRSQQYHFKNTPGNSKL